MKTAVESIDQGIAFEQSLIKNYLDCIDFSKYKNPSESSDFVRLITEDIFLLRRLAPFFPDALIIMKGLVEHLLENEENLPHNYSCFNGRLRAATVFAGLYNEFKNDRYLEAARKFLPDQLLDFVNNPTIGIGLRSGKGSVVLGILLNDIIFPEPAENQRKLKMIDSYLFGFRPNESGLANFNYDNNIKPLNNLADGNAGAIWLLSQTGKKSISANEPQEMILESLVDYIDSSWNERSSTWPSYLKRINNLEDHNLFLHHYYAGDYAFFNHSSESYDFWSGPMGIIVALISYLDGRDHHKRDHLFKQIVAAEKQFYNNCPPNAFKENAREFFYTYVTLFNYSKDQSYLQKAHGVMKMTDTYRDILAIRLCIGNDYDLTALDVLPTVGTQSLSLATGFLYNFSLKIFSQTYPRTLYLLKKHHPDFLDQKNILVTLLDNRCFKYFDEGLKTYLRSSSNATARALKDCFQFELKRRKFIQKFQNKILLKCQEISQREKANSLLSLDESKLQAKKMQLSSGLKIFKTKWNWADSEPNKMEANIVTEPSRFFVLVQPRTHLRESFDIALSDFDLVLLEMFYQPIILSEALNNFFHEFSDVSSEERERIELAAKRSIEFFVFNRILIEV
jgi:hypothetical protein